MEFRDELSGRDGEIRMLSGELKKVENEKNRVYKKLEEMETRLRIRDEEISLLEEKILGLQKTIRLIFVISGNLYFDIKAYYNLTLKKFPNKKLMI